MPLAVVNKVCFEIGFHKPVRLAIHPELNKLSLIFCPWQVEILEVVSE